MIGYIRGPVTRIFHEYCFIDVHGVGYRIYAPAATLAALVPERETTLFTYMHVREDAILLYGFGTQEEYDVFMLLIGVSGVGPKVALGILSAVTPEEFCAAVQRKDLKTLTRMPGSGKKVGDRILFELHDKVASLQGRIPDGAENGADIDSGSHTDEAVEALRGLGYSESEAQTAVASVTGKDLSVEDKIRRALQVLGRGR